MALIRKKAKKLKTAGRSMGGPTSSSETSNLRPEWRPKQAPCMHACPNQNDVRGAMVAIAQREKYGLTLEQAQEIAWKKIIETNPLPAVCGRVCPHPCEDNCNRAELEGPVGINSFERHLGDLGLKNNWAYAKQTDQTREEKIAVVGAGPAGLSCAYQLARKGYPVTIFEAFDKCGGMLRYGIPAYRLPRAVLDAEIQKILDLGIELKNNCAIGREVPYEKLQQEYKAIFVALGAHKGKLLGIEGEEAPNVLTGVDFLNKANSGQAVEIGNDVLVVGGGDTAIDAARVCKRLGAENVTIVYRRTVKEMPAIEEEIKGAEDEGVKMHFLSAPIEFVKDGDRATAMKCIKMELGEPDASGRRRPVPIEGSDFTIETSMVISAISQEPDFDGLDDLRDGRDWVKVDDKYRAQKGERTYGGGDVLDLALVTTAIAQGRHAADTIHQDITGETPEDPVELPIIKTDKMKLAFYEQKERTFPAEMSVADRLKEMDLEVTSTLSDEQALSEAARCMSCGECSLCGTCWSFCQDNAIVQPLDKGEPYKFKLDYCTGCKKCAEECPCGYIEMH